MSFHGLPPIALNQTSYIRDQLRQKQIADEQNTDNLIKSPEETNNQEDDSEGDSPFSDQQRDEGQNPSTIPDSDEQEQNEKHQYHVQWWRRLFGLDSDQCSYTDESSPPYCFFEDDAEAFIKSASLFHYKISRLYERYKRLISNLLSK